MDASIQSKFKPFQSKNSADFSTAKVSNPNASVKDSTAANKTSFKDLLLNSNEDIARMRAAEKNGDGSAAAKTDEEFAKAMSDKLNKKNLRTPKNELDKNSFLKLFVTQMQHQDPLNPDKSSDMAAQLAQFHGLEQMMNVNKNLEKMQKNDSLGRAVSLINFVGKELQLSNGRLHLAGGKLTDATVTVQADAPHAMLEARDAAGVVVATQDIGPLKAGTQKLVWDGKNKDGKSVVDGTYTFSVVAKTINGENEQGKITSTLRVTGVDLADAGGSFYTEVGKVRPAEVISVGQTGFGPTAGGAKKSKEKQPTEKQPTEKHGGPSPVAASTGAEEAPAAVQPVGGEAHVASHDATQDAQKAAEKTKAAVEAATTPQKVDTDAVPQKAEAAAPVENPVLSSPPLMVLPVPPNLTHSGDAG